MEGILEALETLHVQQKLAKAKFETLMREDDDFMHNFAITLTDRDIPKPLLKGGLAMFNSLSIKAFQNTELTNFFLLEKIFAALKHLLFSKNFEWR